jgi:hypothetical protein
VSWITPSITATICFDTFHDQSSARQFSTLEMHLTAGIRSLLLTEPLYSRHIICSMRSLRFFYGRAKFLVWRRRVFRITTPDEYPDRARAVGDTMALLVLAERLIAKSHRKCQAPEFRMEWKSASTWGVRDPKYSESRLARFRDSHEVDLLGPVHCANSECKTDGVTSVE